MPHPLIQLGCLLLTALFALPQPARAADDKKPLSRIAFGSCNHQDKPQTIWEPLLKTKPDLFLFLGDNIYADTEDIDDMRKMYAQLAEVAGFKALKRQCPLLATWDDHDYGKDDAGAEYPKKKESQEAFLDFFGVAKDSPRRAREGVYHAEVLGPPDKRVQVILLDTRYHRSSLKLDPQRPRNKGRYVPDPDDNATMLGTDQWKWLERQLLQPAEIRLVCSSIQVGAEDHGFEKWANLPKERDRLFKLIRDTKAAGVVFLSGDRHIGELTRIDGVAGYPLLDLTSSGMNQGNKRFRAIDPERRRLAILDMGNNFGVVKIDWERNDPLVSLEIHDDDGDVMIRHKINLSRLQPTKKFVESKDGKDLAAEAMKQVGKQWTVEFVVGATGSNKNKTMVFLNSEKDFRSEKNFTVVLPVKGLAADLKKAKIADPQKHYLGKKIKVTGEVALFAEKPQIQVKKLDQIKIAE